MSRQPVGQPPTPPRNATERLESWKEIAAYFGRSVTTVQRWELDEGLPVHRLPHAKRGSVFALKAELDAWRINRVQAGIAGLAVDSSVAVRSIRNADLRGYDVVHNVNSGTSP